MNIRDSLQNEINYHAKAISKVYPAMHGLPESVLDREGFTVAFDIPRVLIKTEDFSKDAKKLLPLVGKWKKHFDSRGSFELRGKAEGFEIALYGDLPSTCSVETVEEEVVVPAVPERVETRTRYRLVGDCLPLFSETEK